MNRFHAPRFLACTISIIGLVAAFNFAGSRAWSVHAEGTTPSAEFIVAAMKNQEKPGLALRVHYTWKISGVIREKPRVNVETVTDRYYVRTPETIFLKDKVTQTYDPEADSAYLFTGNSIVTSSYDRITGEYRKMTRFDGMPEEWEVCQDRNHVREMTRVESVVDDIFRNSMYELLKKSTVFDKRQIVDGHSCWGVAYDMIPDVQRCVVWVDPDIGFCPRRIDVILQKQLRNSKTMRDYREIGYGVWFPREVVFEVFSKTGASVYKTTTTVVDAKVLPIDPKDKLQVDFPPKASVDYDHGQTKQTP